jgi:hypothetical protein
VAINIPASSIERPATINPNFTFWFDDIPSGNTGQDVFVEKNAQRLPKVAQNSPPKIFFHFFAFILSE